jgi:Kdo2-lipid IVA lauroyltransferase/acyltransferase
LKEVSTILGYIFIYPLLWLLSKLPLELLFRISDFATFLIYRVFKYRVNIVKANLRNALPEKSESELLKIERTFYAFLSDVFIEVIKGISMSKEECMRRYTMSDKVKQMMSEYLEKKQSIILVLGHYGMWEMGGAIFGVSTNMYCNVIYRPLSNAFMEKLMKHIRSRYGNQLVPMNDTFKAMLEDKKNNLTKATAFAIDQAAPPESAYWTTFLNQESSVFLGAEKLATKLDYPVVHVYCTVEKRGYYAINTDLITNNPKSLKAGELTELITKEIERLIVAKPDYWLWSHRRWKYKREDKKINSRVPSNL